MRASEFWPETAAQKLTERFSRVRGWPWNRGIWATARADYSRRALSGGLVVEIVEVAGAKRRFAFAKGRGRPIVILPGLYASLDEGMFTDVATLATRSGRPVVLVEDRLAGPTLALNNGEVPGLARQGREIALLLERFGEAHDLLALSAGVALAFAGGSRAARILGWSSVVNPAATVGAVGRSFTLDTYYRRVHQKAFARAGLPVPAIEEARKVLLADGMPEVPAGPQILLAHAVCDPVAPATALREVASAPNARIVLLPLGGHLGFGAVAEDDVYLTPLRT